MATWKEVFPDTTNIVAGVIALCAVLFIVVTPLYMIAKDLFNALN